mgnify:CR=1 FL=1
MHTIPYLFIRLFLEIGILLAHQIPMLPSILLMAFYSDVCPVDVLNCKTQIIFDCISQWGFITYLVHRVHFRFYNPSKAFCWTIVDTVLNSGHGLLHFLFFKFLPKCFTAILNPTIWIKNRFSVWICRSCFIKCFKYQPVAISCTYNICDRISPI